MLRIKSEHSVQRNKLEIWKLGNWVNQRN